MNERIRELAEQADMFVLRDEDGDPQAYYLIGKSIEKFAELIIQECTQLLFDESERLYAYAGECGGLSESDEAELCAEKCVDNIEMIEKHFGVEG